jgi:hypothetical protein
MRAHSMFTSSLCHHFHYIVVPCLVTRTPAYSTPPRCPTLSRNPQSNFPTTVHITGHIHFLPISGPQRGHTSGVDPLLTPLHANTNRNDSHPAITAIARAAAAAAIAATTKAVYTAAAKDATTAVADAVCNHRCICDRSRCHSRRRMGRDHDSKRGYDNSCDHSLGNGRDRECGRRGSGRGRRGCRGGGRCGRGRCRNSGHGNNRGLGRGGRGNLCGRGCRGRGSSGGRGGLCGRASTWL